VTAELPGVEEKDIELTLTNGLLTIRGERRPNAVKRTPTRIGTLSSAAMGPSAVRSRCPSSPRPTRSRPSSTRECFGCICPSRLGASKQQRIEIQKGEVRTDAGRARRGRAPFGAGRQRCRPSGRGVVKMPVKAGPPVRQDLKEGTHCERCADQRPDRRRNSDRPAAHSRGTPRLLRPRRELPCRP
jgi:hypothetical protein